VPVLKCLYCVSVCTVGRWVRDYNPTHQDRKPVLCVPPNGSHLQTCIKRNSNRAETPQPEGVVLTVVSLLHGSSLDVLQSHHPANVCFNDDTTMFASRTMMYLFRQSNQHASGKRSTLKDKPSLFSLRPTPSCRKWWPFGQSNKLPRREYDHCCYR
jgi:hypothetical protein